MATRLTADQFPPRGSSEFLPNRDLSAFSVQVVPAHIPVVVNIDHIRVITQHRLANIYREIMAIVMSVDQPVSPAISFSHRCNGHFSLSLRMRGRRSKNSPVVGLVTVHSGSGSFGLSASGSIALETACRKRSESTRQSDSCWGIEAPIFQLLSCQCWNCPLVGWSVNVTRKPK